MPLASAFRARGDEVAVATAASYGPRVESTGLDSLPAGIDQETLQARFAPHRDEISRLPIPERRRHGFSRRFALIDAPARIEELRQRAEEWQPDLLVHEPAELAGPLVAEALRIASAQHTFGRMIPLAVIEEAAVVAAPMWDEAGVAPQPQAGMFRGAYVDICPRALGSELPPAGTPVLPLRAVSAAPAEASGRPLLYVTLGTVFSGPETYRVILAGLADCNADVVLTTGRQNDPAELGPLPANVTVERFIPQAELLPRCTLVVTHCGSGSMLGALAHGLPLLALPNLADQFENAAAVDAAGAGEVLLPGELTSETVRSRVEALLSDSRYREAARELASEIAALPSPAEVAEQLTLYAA